MTDDLGKAIAESLNKKQTIETQDNNLIIGSVKSGLSSIGEMFGADPISGTPKFRAEHPGLALGADLIGPGGVYVKGYKWARSSKKLEKFRETFGDINKNPFTVGAAREVISMAPLELARLGTAAVLNGGDNFGDVLSSVAFDTVLTGAFGAAAGGLRAYGKSARGAAPVLPGVNLRDPVQLQIKEIVGRMKIATEPAEQTQLYKGLKMLEAEIRLEKLRRRRLLKIL